MPITTFYFHDAASGVGGTLPGASSQSATTPTLTATGASTNKSMDGTKGAAQIAATLTSSAVVTLQKNWLRRFVSPPLGAQVIPTTGWNLVGASITSNATNSAWFIQQGVLYVWRPGTGVRVQMLQDGPGNSGGGSGAAASETWHTYGLFNLTSGVTCQLNDVLVFEVWGAVTQAMSTAYTWTYDYDGTNDFTSQNTAETSAASALIAPSAISLASDVPLATVPRIISQAVQRAATRCWKHGPSGIVVPRLWTPADGVA